MRFQVQQIREALSMLPAEVVYKAARSTVNKVGPSAKTTAKAEIRKVWNVPSAELDKKINATSATNSNLEYVIDFGGRSISLSYFEARQMKGAAIVTRKGTKVRKRGGHAFQGVAVTIEKSKTTLLANAFMQAVKSGHVGIFVRTTKSRYPIQHKDSISVASMVSQPRVNDAVVARIEERIDTVFPHELAYYAGEAAR